MPVVKSNKATTNRFWGRQYRRPRTRIGQIFNTWWVWPALVGFIIGAALYGASDAHADGLDRVESDYVITFGPTAICPVLDEYHTPAGVFGVVHGIMVDGFAAEDAVQMVNTAVAVYCPRNWPLLEAVGRAARISQGQAA